MAVAASSAQAAIIAAGTPARPSPSARSSSLTQSRPTVFKRVEISEFAGLKSTSCCITYGRQARENNLSLFDAVASQVVAKAANSGAVRGETVAKMRVAINGFGRIGRNFLRSLHGHKNSQLEVVAINDIHNVENAAHLLQYDSLLGKFEVDVTGVYKGSVLKVADATGVSKAPGEESGRFMTVDGRHISIFSEKSPVNLPWKQLGVDLVIEGTGVFLDKSNAHGHITAGAKKVIITAPPKVGEDIPMFVGGINYSDYSHEKHDIISNASGVTNCVAPILRVLGTEFNGIVKGSITSTLSYTSDQSLIDALHCDKRISRAAALNIVPMSTPDIANTLSLVLPSLNLREKLTGIAFRVPTPKVSVVDLVINVGTKGIKIEEVKEAFKNAANGYLKGILEVSDHELVSMDFYGNNASAIIDNTLTSVIGDDMIKVVAWYDNEWAYSRRVVELAHTVQIKRAEATGEDYVSYYDHELTHCEKNSETCKIHYP